MKQILYFSAGWCQPCKTFKPQMEALKSEGLPIQFLDVEQNLELSQQHSIRNVPTTVFLTNDPGNTHTLAQGVRKRKNHMTVEIRRK